MSEVNRRWMKQPEISGESDLYKNKEIGGESNLSIEEGLDGKNISSTEEFEKLEKSRSKLATTSLVKELDKLMINMSLNGLDLETRNINKPLIRYELT